MIKYYNTWLPDVSEQAILWRLHTTGEVLLLVMKEIAPRRLQLETVTAFGVRVSSWSIWGTTPCTANLSMTWRSVRRMNSLWMATRSSASKPAVRDQRPCLGRTELTEMIEEFTQVLEYKTNRNDSIFPESALWHKLHVHVHGTCQDHVEVGSFTSMFMCAL